MKMGFTNNILDRSGLFVILWYTKENCIKFNRYIQDITGFYHIEALGTKSLDCFLDKYNKVKFIRSINYIERHNTHLVHEGGITCKDGKVIYVLWNSSPLYDYKGELEAVVSVGVDITERKNAEKKLEANYRKLKEVYQEKINYMTYYDPLTGLPNRGLFEKKLEESIGESIKNNSIGAVFFLGIDNFKSVNDTFGHSVGDELLRNISSALRFFEKEDITIARFGGDEFVIMIHNAESHNYVTGLASDMLLALNRTWSVNGIEFHITVSIGIAFYPDAKFDAKGILSNADCAMYLVKKSGKGNYSIYSSNMNYNLIERIDMENNLRQALKRQEFILHYQPQINQKSGEIVGVEALIRWQHPTKGFISPGYFIPVAEEIGLIVNIGEWVLREACIQNKRWQDMGCKKFEISVNVSPDQLKQYDLINNIKAILEETGLEPQWLCLEITESIAISDINFAVKTLESLKEIGVKIALDDFGVGYSSLSYVRRLPINYIKIDKCFVDEINGDTQEAAIIEAIIVMAHKMDIKVVAEGIETLEQHEFLKQKNCDISQGYLFSRPLTAEQIERLIKSGSPFCSDLKIK